MKRNILMVLLAIGFVGMGYAADASQQSGSGKARNVILMIGDGTGLSQVALYAYYAERVLQQRPAFADVMDRGVCGYMRHDPANGLVTDSAAAMTAMACGIKTLNKSIGIDPDGKAWPSVLEIAKKYGKRTGIVSTCPPFDATESALTSHVVLRDEYDEIFDWTFTKTQPDLIAGNELSLFGHDQKPVSDLAERNGYRVVTKRSDLDSVASNPTQKLYGAFDVQTLFTDSAPDPAREFVQLSEMTEAALAYFASAENGFFLMVEGSKIDWRCHANDGAAAMREMEGFDRAVRVAFDFAAQRDDTLLIVTADHETGGMAILGGDDSTLAAIGKQKEPLADVHKRLGKEASAAQIQQALGEALGFELTSDEAEKLHTVWAKDPREVMNEIIRKHFKIGFVATSHSAEPVMLVGYGPGSKRCGGWRDNTDVFSIVLDGMGLPHE